MRTYQEIAADKLALAARQAELAAEELAAAAEHKAAQAVRLDLLNSQIVKAIEQGLDMTKLAWNGKSFVPFVPVEQQASARRTKASAAPQSSGPWIGKGRAEGYSCEKQGPDYVVSRDNEHIGSFKSLSGAGAAAVEDNWLASGAEEERNDDGKIAGFAFPDGSRKDRASVAPSQVWEG